MNNWVYEPFPESMHKEPAEAHRLSRVEDQENIEISLYVKPRPANNMLVSREKVLANRELLYRGDLDIVKTFARDHGLKVLEADTRRRRVRLSGTAAQMRTAFKVDLYWYQGKSAKFRAYTGVLQVRSDLKNVLESVLGLDERTVAQPRLRRIETSAVTTSNTYLPNQIAGFYGIPVHPTGTGECIAIIELGGGFHQSDIRAAFAAMGLTPPNVLAISVDGGENSPTTPDSADGEVGLDIQVAGAVAPGALIVVYFTQNTDAGFADAVSGAATDRTHNPSVMSISWGSPESEYSAQARNTLNSALQDAAEAGVTITVAAGDNLSTDGLNDGAVHVDFPASSPYVVACGGTGITVSNERISREVVWNNGTSGTGGGISGIFPVPSFQEQEKLPVNVSTRSPGRGLPDVAADANPYSGYQVTVDGETFPVGGTSAVAPLWAGFFALANSARGSALGYVNQVLYSQKDGFREILHGNNIPAKSNLGYQAGPGWNACCGLGVMIGPKLFQILIK
ncbi:S8 family serine peptidase [Acidithiobacillus ferrooxidans]|uniref:S53 family peptidase n=1 Tax=Acidithiobacillus ferrooxidans TaxID=920 RepID=UPI001C070FC7|nr:S53 family peptidase [Acidithiobacillus ferrooxidans]MBU2856285.1 S8 family serine peptidase [Acidithiobacillus ferrooxidans]MBU2858886.1 S8 family serine peptidase [Acidithiobacillus ferrooxidans]MCL5957255.1 S53 family peptidase [Gammaproteobacteria bacterium]